jgi:sigma-E factor negative regulatory protein RseC
MTVYNPLDVTEGETVVVGIPESVLLTVSVVAYIVPLVAMIGGGIAGSLLGEHLLPHLADVLSVSGGVAGLAAGLGGLRRFSRAHERDARYRAVILRRARVHASPVSITLRSTGE